MSSEGHVIKVIVWSRHELRDILTSLHHWIVGILNDLSWTRINFVINVTRRAHVTTAVSRDVTKSLTQMLMNRWGSAVHPFTVNHCIRL